MNQSQKIHKKTWYGLTATVIIGPGFMHTAGWGGFLIPHPPLANWLLRLGLSKNNREALTVIHEFKHLQSVPFILIYAFLLFALAYAAADVEFAEIILLAASSQAAWEILSEILTINCDIESYRNAYGKVTPIPRMVFWFACCVLTVSGWLIMLL